MIINTDFLAWHIKDNGLVHCANVDEYMELFDVLREIGFKIGFEPSKRDLYRYVGLGYTPRHSDEIHAGGSYDSMNRNTVNDRTVVEFSDFVIDDDEEISPENLDVLFS